MLCPFPDHYERTRIDGKEHPADAVIDKLPAVVRARRRVLGLFEKMLPSTKDQRALRAYADAHGQYQTLREGLFYDAGYEHGLIRARQDHLGRRTGKDSAAHDLLREISQLVLSAGLPQNRVVMLLLEAAWALVPGISQRESKLSRHHR